uniref:V-SNARE coiled-coil homology domain-containing protein n=1 Tax=Syphacia muris TaxID=451379 RepID=A0A0N5AYR2_9BILA
MDRAKKKLVSALDGLRLSKNKAEVEFDEKVTQQHVCFSKIVRHGFPDDPRCIAYDPMQRLLAIGTGSGLIRVFGDAGVDWCLYHKNEAAVTNIQFLINEGALITVCRDDSVHLWNYRQKVPKIVHSVQLNKEQITCVNLPFQSKWLYLGTERGNVYFVSVATFKLSSYVINWNKAIDLSCRTHPGCVKSVLTCPSENTKILLLFEKGFVVIWNLQTKEVDRFVTNYPVRSVAWLHDGRQFICGNSDGSLSIWNVKKPNECVQKMYPHGEKCRPVTQVDWSVTAEGEQLIMFSGGMSQEDGVLPAITILRANRSATVFEMEHPLVAFTPLTVPSYPNEPQHHFGLAVLLKSDLLVIDLQSPGYPCFEHVNPVDIHESPIVYLKYFSDCPVDLIGALTLVGCKQRRQTFSKKAWPISGGIGRECATGHQELLITGHEDGSLKFWHTTGEHLQILYKLKTGRHFERSEENDGRDVSHAVSDLVLCLESRLLVVCSQSSQITLFHFAKNESFNEIAVITIHHFTSISPGVDEDVACNVGSVRDLRHPSLTSRDSHSTTTSEGSSNGDYFPLKVRGGSMRRPAGYQPEMVCMIPWRSCSQPETVTALALNSAYGFVAFGTSSGLVVVDTTQYVLVYTLSYLDFYGKESPMSFPQGFEHMSNELDTPEQRSSPSPNSIKSFSKATSEMRQRSNEKQRPVLSKTQSVAEQAYEDTWKDSQLYADELRSNNGPGKRESRSPSQTSQDKVVPPDFITSLYFIHSYPKKNERNIGPCLWMGTANGFFVVFSIQIPSDRTSSPAFFSSSGFFFRQRGQHLYTTFLDKSFCLLSGACNTFHDSKDTATKGESSEKCEKGFVNRVITKSSLSPTFSNASDFEDEIEQVLVSVSEDEVRVIALPSFSLLFFYRPDISFVQARATHVRGFPVLALINSVGQIVVLSLPTLRHLMCTPLYHHALEIGDQFCHNTSLSEYGLGFYSVSPSEIQKFTICSELAAQVKDCAGELFVPVDMPEPPKSSFFKGVSTLFAGTHKEEVDLDLIFGEKTPVATGNSGMRTVGRNIAGHSCSVDSANARAMTAGQAASAAVQALNERGEKLNATVDATERLMENAMSFSQRTSKLVEKYEKKKWYNF